MVSDQERRDLFEALNLSLGEGPATTLMELLPPVGWADVARQSDVAAVRGEIAQFRGEMAGLGSELRGEMADLKVELRGEMADLKVELRGEMVELRGEMAELRGELKGEMAELRGEMAELRGEVDAQLPRFLWSNVPIMFGVAGLVLAAAKLA